MNLEGSRGEGALSRERAAGPAVPRRPRAAASSALVPAPAWEFRLGVSTSPSRGQKASSARDQAGGTSGLGTQGTGDPDVTGLGPRPSPVGTSQTSHSLHVSSQGRSSVDIVRDVQTRPVSTSLILGFTAEIL